MNSKQKTQIIKLQFAIGLIALAIICLALTVTSVIASPAAIQEPNAVELGDQAIFGLAIGAGLAMGLAGVGAALALGTASSAAIGAIAERPEVFGRTIIFIAFIEGIGVFGFVIAFMLYLAIGQIIAG
ncbi:MAG: V-type ATP synthase subunit K [Candidatus Heimdallarchaeota archaeon]|nr:MAG: V-type ATP synthase subunit K [Candidatus Heimdallarchaeota archaeon]